MGASWSPFHTKKKSSGTFMIFTIEIINALNLSIRGICGCGRRRRRRRKGRRRRKRTPFAGFLLDFSFLLHYKNETSRMQVLTDNQVTGGQELAGLETGVQETAGRESERRSIQ